MEGREASNDEEPDEKSDKSHSVSEEKEGDQESGQEDRDSQDQEANGEDPKTRPGDSGIVQHHRKKYGIKRR